MKDLEKTIKRAVGDNAANDKRCPCCGRKLDEMVNGEEYDVLRYAGEALVFLFSATKQLAGEIKGTGADLAKSEQLRHNVATIFELTRYF